MTQKQFYFKNIGTTNPHNEFTANGRKKHIYKRQKINNQQ